MIGASHGAISSRMQPDFGVFSCIRVVVPLLEVGLRWRTWVLPTAGRCGDEAVAGQSPHGLGAEGFHASIMGLG